MLDNLETGTNVVLELEDGTVLKDLRVNGSNFVSDTPIDSAVFEDNLGVVLLLIGDEIQEYADLKLIQNRKFGDEYMFVLSEKTQAEKDKEELEQLMADIAELTLEVLS